MSDSLMHTYKPLPISFERGEGAWLWDSNGKRYLDGLSGVAVCALGHAHPEIAATIADQAATLIHTSNHYRVAYQQELADRLAAISGMDRVFFGNSGAEANEAAIKLARLFGHAKGIQDPLIIVTEKSFHGRTLATLSATGNRKIQAGFEPLVHGFVRVPYGDAKAIENVLRNSHNVVAILVEPVQGEGGVNVPPRGYLSRIRELCDQHDILMMLDEIQTGLCRTGRWFAFQHENAMPDVMTLAKSLGNGVPIGACLSRGKAADLFKPGSHGSTYGGNPLVCRVALNVLEIMEREKLVQRSEAMGAKLLNLFGRQLDGVGGVTAIRGFGMMIGIELDRPCAELVAQSAERGVLINVTADKVVRLLPPLILSDDQATTLTESVSALIKQFLRS